MALQSYFDRAWCLERGLEADQTNVFIQYQLIDTVDDILQYSIAHCNDKPLLNKVLRFLIDLFFKVVELNYDTVECVLDVLTTTRIIVRSCIMSFES